MGEHIQEHIQENQHPDIWASDIAAKLWTDVPLEETGRWKEALLKHGLSNVIEESFSDSDEELFSDIYVPLFNTLAIASIGFARTVVEGTKYQKAAGLPPEDLEIVKRKIILKHLHELTQLSERLAREQAIESVKNNYLSRVEVARLLEIHQATVARWVNQAGQQDDDHKDARTA